METPLLDGIRKEAINRISWSKEELLDKGFEYLGNIHTGRLHHLSRSKANCQIDAILTASHGIPFKNPKDALELGFGDDFCDICMPDEVKAFN